METQHQEILQSFLEIDEIRSSPRYKSLILMSRQANERKEYEVYSNKIRMHTNKIEKIKESFPNNYGMTYDQYLISRTNTEIDRQKKVDEVQISEPKAEAEVEPVIVVEQKNEELTVIPEDIELLIPQLTEDTDFD